MLEAEINFGYEIMNDLRASHFDDAKNKAHTLLVRIKGVEGMLLKKYSNEKPRFYQVKDHMHKLKKALHKVKHYALRAGRNKKPEVINFLRAKALEHCQETVKFLQELQRTE